MKTVHQLVQEYLNREREPQYEELGIHSGTGSGYDYSYIGVTNLREEWDANGKFLAFDCKQNGKKKHVRIMGYVTREVSSIKE